MSTETDPTTPAGEPTVEPVPGNGQHAELTPADILPSNQILARHTQRTSVFEDIRRSVYKYRYEVKIVVDTLVGGTPSNPKVAEGWLKSKLATSNEELITDMVASTMAERQITPDQAIEEATRNKHLNGFKRLADTGELTIEGRHGKAMIKESANIRWPKARWGDSRKGTRGFFSEHVFVEEDAIPLGVHEPTRIGTRFVATWRGTGIQMEEIVEDAEITFHILTDHDFKEREWGELLVTAEINGLGAARSQGFGTFTVVGFRKVNHPRRNQRS